jgi:hypothetical protein
MGPQSVRFFDGHKFMWDGEVSASRDAAESRRTGYADRGFETQLTEEENGFLVYTRRVVTEVVVQEGPPPA